MPPSIDPEVHAVVGRVAARNCSIISAIREEFVAFPDSKSQEAFCRNARKHVQNRRIVEKEEADCQALHQGRRESGSGSVGASRERVRR